MISFLKGKIESVKIGCIDIEIAGIGYKVFIPHRLAPKIGQNVKLYIHENIKEDAHDLYGFEKEGDLDIFQKLLSVSGVGPKAAIAILSLHDANRINQSISNSDTAFFTQVPGIGQKVAGKIIIELKSKIDIKDTEKILQEDNIDLDILEALISLGFKRPEALNIVKTIPKELTTEQQKISFCLKSIGK